MSKKIIKLGFFVALAAVLFVFIYFFTNNTTFSKKEFYVTIPTGANYDDVQKIIKPFISNYASFEFLANLRKYPDNVKSGRFLFKKGMSSFQLVSSLRHNIPVNLHLIIRND